MSDYQRARGNIGSNPYGSQTGSGGQGSNLVYGGEAVKPAQDQTKFKVGDRVMVTTNSNDTAEQKGTVTGFYTFDWGKTKVTEVVVSVDEYVGDIDHDSIEIYGVPGFTYRHDQLILIPAPSAPEPRTLTLPVDSQERKNYPLLRGCLKYFPAAIAGVSNISKLGNDKHNPGEDLHHARSKSMDHGDCVLRHLMDVEDLRAARQRGGGAGVTKEQILTEVNQLAWRVLAYSQALHEELGAPLAPGAKDGK